MRHHRTLTPIVFILSLLFWPALVQADYQAGEDAYFRGDYATAFKEWRPLAEAGNGEAQSFLGEMYRKGEGVTQDYQKAANWYRRAADQGIVDSQYNVGVMYERGEGVVQDYREGARWFRKAAEQGFAEAQYSLGWMYVNGQGVEKKKLSRSHRVVSQGRGARKSQGTV